MKTLLPFLCLVFYCFSCTPAAENAETTPAPEPVSEVETAINQAVQDAYAVISFPAGQRPDYEALKALFTPDAVLYNFRDDTLEFSGLDEFIEGFQAAVDAGEMKAFREVELGGKTEYFGKIGHRISSYASYFDGAEEPGERGVNSFQVVNVNGQWLISAIIWDVEKEGQPIPEKYLDSE